MQRKINITLPLIRCIKENPLIRKTATLNMLKLMILKIICVTKFPIKKTVEELYMEKMRL